MNGQNSVETPEAVECWQSPDKHTEPSSLILQMMSKIFL